MTTTRSSVRFGDTVIEYEVRRSRRRKKTVQISVDGGDVRVASPVGTSDEDLRAIVRKRAAWILKHSTEAMPEAAPKRFVSGETLPYLGRNVMMIVKPADARHTVVRFDHWRFRIDAPSHLNGDERTEALRKAIVVWYRERAAEHVLSVVKRWWPRLGQGEMSPILIRDQRQRWGSCSSNGTLRFNWRAMMLKPALIEYIVAHELAHLTHQNHAKEFWNLLASVMPDSQQRRRDLREAGRRLPL